MEFIVEEQIENSTAVVVCREDRYLELAEAVGERLKEKGCLVRLVKKLPSYNFDYCIFFGAPAKKELHELSKYAGKQIIALTAKNLTSAQKENLKNFSVFFLPKPEGLNGSLIDDILSALFSRPLRTSARPEVAPEVKGIEKYERISLSDKQRDGYLESHPVSDKTKHLVEKVPHLRLPSIRPLIYFLLPLFILLLLPLYPIYEAVQLKTSLNKSLNELSSMEFAQAEISANKSRRSLNRLQSVYNFSRPATERLFPQQIGSVKTALAVAEDTISFIETASETGARGHDFLQKILSNQSVEAEVSSAYFLPQTRKLRKLTNSLVKNTEALKQQNTYLSSRLISVYSPKAAILQTANEYLQKAERVIPLLPELIAAKGRKKYLVLFQNNMELRPTGGFIGSVGFLRFENGKMLELTVEDVYNLDGQLRGHVDPPEPIREHLGQPDWFLRDANWDPDFALSAKQIQWFLDKEIQTSVDGVIAADLKFAKQVLSAMDGVYLPDFNKLITADNIYLETQTHTEEDFFPGATNKKDILGSLARNLLIGLSDTNNLPADKLLSALFSSLQKKHILLNFASPELQSVVDELGWSGRLLKPGCEDTQKAGCFPDYLMLVEANLGVNKVNYFIERSTQFSANITNNKLQRKLKINYKNNSVSSELPGGDYKNYLRILLPPDVAIESVRLNKQEYNPLRLDTAEFGPYRSYGLLVNVPSSNERHLEVVYSSPFKETDPEFVYELLVQKQPGTDRPSFTLSFSLPPGKKVVPLNFNSEVAPPQPLIYNTTLSTDRVFRVKLY